MRQYHYAVDLKRDYSILEHIANSILDTLKDEIQNKYDSIEYEDVYDALMQRPSYELYQLENNIGNLYTIWDTVDVVNIFDFEDTHYKYDLSEFNYKDDYFIAYDEGGVTHLYSFDEYDTVIRSEVVDDIAHDVATYVMEI